MLLLKGTIVTTDALKCQREIARTTVGKEGGCALVLKGNHGTLVDNVRRLFDDPECRA
jgi:predicted transposase YbfD/YdcC